MMEVKSSSNLYFPVTLHFQKGSSGGLGFLGFAWMIPFKLSWYDLLEFCFEFIRENPLFWKFELFKFEEALGAVSASDDSSSSTSSLFMLGIEYWGTSQDIAKKIEGSRIDKNFIYPILDQLYPMVKSIKLLKATVWQKSNYTFNLCHAYFHLAKQLNPEG